MTTDCEGLMRSRVALLKMEWESVVVMWIAEENIQSLPICKVVPSTAPIWIRPQNRLLLPMTIFDAVSSNQNVASRKVFPSPMRISESEP